MSVDNGTSPENQVSQADVDGQRSEVNCCVHRSAEHVVAELRARALETIEEAGATIPTLRRGGHMVAMHTAVGMVATCETFIEWLDELSVCDKLGPGESR